MKILLAILAVVLAIPPLFVIGIALGPIALLIVWGILVVSPFVAIGWAGVRIADRRSRHIHG